jgi:hypothetical protein
VWVRLVVVLVGSAIWLPGSALGATTTLRIRVVQGRRRLNLSLTLAAGGRSTPAVVQVARR